MQILEKFNRKGVTVVMVTHNPEQGKRARRVINLRDGFLQTESTVLEALHAE
jgi:ABC-type lipoprotein export system ATPase subunit